MDPHQQFFAEISKLETLKFDVKCQIFMEPFSLEKQLHSFNLWIFINVQPY